MKLFIFIMILIGCLVGTIVGILDQNDYLSFTNGALVILTAAIFLKPGPERFTQWMLTVLAGTVSGVVPMWIVFNIVLYVTNN